MTKSDLIKKVAESADISPEKASQAVTSMLAAIESALSDGDKVTLIGFGTFSTTNRRSRKGINPRTGKRIHIAEKTVVRFKAGSRLTSKVK